MLGGVKELLAFLCEAEKLWEKIYIHFGTSVETIAQSCMRLTSFFFFLTHPSRSVYILTPAKCSPFSLFFSYRNLSLYHSFASIIVYYSFSIPSVSLILLPLLLFFFFVLCLSRVGDSLKPLHWCNSIESCFQDMSLTVGIL